MLLDNKTTCKAIVPLALINMNNVINKILLAGDKFMPEMHLRQPQFIYSACGPFTRHKERIKKLKKTGVLVIFIEMSSIMLVFNTILLIQIIKI